MAADTLRDFLENGHIRNSVNFPDAALPRQSGSIRIAIANSNMPNMVGQISTALAERRPQHRGAAEPLARRVCLHADRCRGRSPMRRCSGDCARSMGCCRCGCCPRAIEGGGEIAGQERGMQGVSQPKSAPDAPKDLSELRAKIDAIDEQLHALLNERARLAQQAGISKHQDGHTVDFYRPEREAEVLRRALERNRGPLRDEEIVRVFREIMSACLAQQEPLKVAFLGPEGTFTQSGRAQAFRSLGARAGAQHRR